MRQTHPHRASLALWTLLGLTGLAAFVWSYHRFLPFYPERFELSRGEAIAIALERFRDLGEPVAKPYVVARLSSDTFLEVSLQKALFAQQKASSALTTPAPDLRRSQLAKELLEWEVTVYEPGKFRNDWRYQARVGVDGVVRTLRERVPPTEKREPVAREEALRRAVELLAAQGFDLAGYEEPTVRLRDLAARTDTDVRFRSRERTLGDDFPHGIEVSFAGTQLTGWGTYYDDPDSEVTRRVMQPAVILNQSRILVLFLLLIVVGVFFVKRYHEGEVGVTRAMHIFAFVLVIGMIGLSLVSAAATQDSGFGPISRQQQTWVWGVQLFMLFFLPMGLVAALSWSVGESLCRETWGRKLAAFDALWHGDLANATVARSALRGTMAAFMVLGGASLLLTGLRRFEVWTPFSQIMGPWWESAAVPSIAMVAIVLSFGLYGELFGRLFMLPLLVRRYGALAGGFAAALVSALLFWPQVFSVPLWPSLLIWLGICCFYVFLFVRYDLLTALLASLVSQLGSQAFTLLQTSDYGLQTHGAIAFGVTLLPLALTIRHLASDREFEYRYQDIPPHVRRIADRERQRVELETARNIQSSILPELPPQLNGVEIAHSYIPASEVGGDFYDVLALDDGRLAVAVGDVAGHGVSSGLVMSMAKSALAVQVTFNPEVEAVFVTMNRMVHQSARRRLLATLCYMVLDPRRRRLEFGSAGHLVPYRISKDGKIDTFESTSYPLGVRRLLEVQPRAARLEAGDTLVLYSDGVIEARREGSEEQFGFPRFEKSLAAHASRGPQGLRDAILRDLQDFTGDTPREDDLTLLILRVP